MDENKVLLDSLNDEEVTKDLLLRGLITQAEAVHRINNARQIVAFIVDSRRRECNGTNND